MQNVGNKESQLAPIDYRELPTQTLCNLKSISDRGRTLYVGDSSIQNRTPVDWNQNGLKDIINNSVNVFTQRYKESLQNQPNLPTQATTTGNIPEETTAAPENVTEAQTEPATTEPATTEAATTEAATTQAPTTQAATTEAATTETATTEEETEEEAGGNNTEPTTKEETTEKETESGTAGEAEEDAGSSVTSYTVTFVCDGLTFAKQTVAIGKNASRPLLQPTSSGWWLISSTGAPISSSTNLDEIDPNSEYDFNTPVNENITVYWYYVLD